MKNKAVYYVNILLIIGIFVGNYIYQSNGFDFTWKMICSGTFAVLGIINFIYALSNKCPNLKTAAFLAMGSVFAFLGDAMINRDFIIGAALFALGHVLFVVAYFLYEKLRKLDLIISGALIAATVCFILFCPLLEFDVPVFKYVCLVYAMIISFMVGKAVGNAVHRKNKFVYVVAAGSGLFFFSDLMLLFDWFMNCSGWSARACMGTYYPGVCALVFAIYVLVNGEADAKA